MMPFVVKGFVQRTITVLEPLDCRVGADNPAGTVKGKSI